MSLPACFGELRVQYNLDPAVVDYLTAPEPNGLGLETMADFGDIFTKESEVQKVIDDIPAVKTSFTPDFPLAPSLA